MRKTLTQKLVKRALKSMDYKTLCRKMRCSQPTLSAWNTGKHEMNYPRGKKLEDIIAKAESQ